MTAHWQRRQYGAVGAARRQQLGSIGVWQRSGGISGGGNMAAVAAAQQRIGGSGGNMVVVVVAAHSTLQC